MELVKLNSDQNVKKTIDEGNVPITIVEMRVKNASGKMEIKEACFLIGHGYSQDQIDKIHKILKEKYNQKILNP